MQRGPSGGPRASGHNGFESGNIGKPGSATSDRCGQGSSENIIAKLHPPERRTGVRYTGTYAVSFRGERIVTASRDPECDLARVLFARGIVGKIKVMDAITGTHRSTINIEKAAKLCVKEG